MKTLSIKRWGRLWVAVDVGLVDPHGNKHGLDDSNVLAYIRLLAWSKQHRTDGLIPLRPAGAIVSRATLAGSPSAPLVAAGLVTVDQSGITVCDWLKWNESNEEAEARRERDRARKRDDALRSKNYREEKRRDSAWNTRGVSAESDHVALTAPCRSHNVDWQCVADPDGCRR